MPTKSQIEAQNLYANLLQEVKLRFEAINHCTLGKSGLAPPFVKDFCYLQLRMICELVALGCLVAHGDIKETSAMQREWSAQKIMDALERLLPTFYPRAVIARSAPIPPPAPPGTIGAQLLPVNPSPLPKAEFLKLYWKCHDMLHRGSLKKLLKGQFPAQVNYPEIAAMGQQIANLLAHHVLFLQGGQMVLVAMLQSPGDNNCAHVAIAETQNGQPFCFPD